MSAWLASVVDAAEARLALDAGVGIVDAKNPMRGALGDLPHAAVRAIVAAVDGRAPVSATVGDFPDMPPDAVRAAVAAMAETGVDFVKLGCFPAASLHACLDALAPLAARHALVAVLFADRDPDFALLPRLAAWGFRGVMLDTADKTGGGLTRCQSPAQLAAFVAQARRHGLFSGLAGSLRLADIPALAALEPDYLGFRGALCGGHARTAALDAGALAAVSRAMRRHRRPRAAAPVFHPSTARARAS